MSDENEQALQWKRKYFSALEDLEKQEQSAADNDAILRRSLSRLSLALDGFDERLDKELNRLRDDIRSGRKSLHIGQITESISEAAQQQTKQFQARPKNSHLLLKLLKKTPLPSPLNKQKKSLIHELTDTHADEHINAHLEAVTLLFRAAQSLGEKEGATVVQASAGDMKPEKNSSSGNGLFGRLFNKSDTSLEVPDISTALVNSSLSQLLDEVTLPHPVATQVGELNQQLGELKSEEAISQVISQLAALLSSKDLPTDNRETSVEPVAMANDVLLQLLERITLCEPYSQELTKLRLEVTKQLSMQEIKDCLEKLANLISRAQALNKDDKQELEGFLKQITETLVEIDEQIRGNQQHQQQAKQGTHQLDSAVQEHVEEMQASILQVHGFGELKQSIQTRLTTIRKQVRSYREETDERHHLMEQAMTSLVNKVAKVESESHKLRDNLKQQRDRAMHDPLTGIHNRLAYDEFLAHEYSRWQRRRHDITMIIWDIDLFKNVNDTFGHQAGDKALKVVAQILRGHLRGSDYLARFGGEEFVSLLPETDINGALAVANLLREKIAHSEFHYKDDRVSLTISCGIAQFHEGDDPDLVFQRADAALYQAKEQGRNLCKLEVL